MSGFWHPNEELSLEQDAAREHSVLGFRREAVLYFLAAWDQHWGIQEQIRVRYGCPPWVVLLSPARRAELGITTGHPFLDGNDALRPLLDS